MKAETILIQDARLQRPIQRVLLAWITFLAWIAWSFLWLPLITLIAWLIGMHTSYVNLFLHEHNNGSQNILMLLAGMTLCMLIVLLWSNYNYYRFRHVPRRRHSRTYDLDEMAAKLAVEKETAMLLRTSTCVVVYFRDDGAAYSRSET
ncbi:poly-beta-1,6-N-acetyl-D-glucosamine biosynthesis protein PgaD [Rhodanobacter sp. A1T4]|uniref:poly-beta-1,6-N-acetyl-D-glucosamine biosynthesis protein PgaD n=1 Tax=Rhodanobacter sp. A1T4 TaxID=2723087 RepID=UPI00160B3DD6|nr:poly-beta-1,6-N-acetyl-D-glucosamine biosynthesis protein PgaD [Rhodanobacter sp. A1T4]MBB6246466.1 biofilm PGA synthesis protein PgaD [Rhodanobacter sp. A1T4]